MLADGYSGPAEFVYAVGESEFGTIEGAIRGQLVVGVAIAMGGMLKIWRFGSWCCSDSGASCRKLAGVCQQHLARCAMRWR